MKHFLDWKEYKDAGMGDPYAGIPKRGGDFAKAISVCINSRQCETQDRGVMCPSYRVTQNAALTPGGRVRLLKRALSSPTSQRLLFDKELAEAMDLCVGCKGCKRECENSVDLAQIKIEYLAQQHQVQALPWRTRLLANLPRWLHRWPFLGHLPYWLNRSSLLQSLASRLLGLAKRPLPVTSQSAFQEPSLPLDESKPLKAVVFIDTFSRYYQPDVAKAALELLQAGGCDVQLASPQSLAETNSRPLCCGRSYLAQGLVQQAKNEAQRVVDALLPWVEKGYVIIGLEPSCLLAIRDDYRALGLGEAAEILSRNSCLLEEFLAKHLRSGQLKLQFKPAYKPDTPLLVHGHCHQKAVGAMKSMRKVMALLPETSVEFIEASCCGMGGSFGYEQEHLQLSEAMAAEALLPALRENPDAELIANGFSCRQQIHHLTGRQAKHLIQVLRERLDLQVQTPNPES